MNKDAINTQFLVECLAQMALVLLEQKRDTHTAVVEAGAGVSEEHEALVNLALTEVGVPRGQARYILRRELEQTSLPPLAADRRSATQTEGFGMVYFGQ